MFWLWRLAPSAVVRFLVCFALLLGVGQAASFLLTAPVADQLTPVPFAAGGNDYQQIYSNAILNQAIAIKEIDFFADISYAGQIVDGATWTVSLAATMQWVNNLRSDNLDMNYLGAGRQAVDEHGNRLVTPEVFYTGNLTVGADGRVRIIGQTPFYFNPTQGNLILDIYRQNSVGKNALSAVGGVQLISKNGGYNPNSNPSWINATNPNWNYAFSRGGNTVPDNWNLKENQGLVTEFIYGDNSIEGTPEPGTLLLFGAGFTAMLVVARRRGRTAR